MPTSAFRDAIEAADHLRWRGGLQAVKRGEGKGQIVARDSLCLLGSADIDGDCTAAQPNSERWDYVIGYNRFGKAVAHYVEVHSAQTSEVSKIEGKLQWLLDFLRQDHQQELKRLPAEFHWVASGRINIPRHTPQFRRLKTSSRLRCLKGPVKSLQLS